MCSRPNPRSTAFSGSGAKSLSPIKRPTAVPTALTEVCVSRAMRRLTRASTDYSFACHPVEGEHMILRRFDTSSEQIEHVALQRTKPNIRISPSLKFSSCAAPRPTATESPTPGLGDRRVATTARAETRSRDPSTARRSRAAKSDPMWSEGDSQTASARLRQPCRRLRTLAPGRCRQKWRRARILF